MADIGRNNSEQFKNLFKTIGIFAKSNLSNINDVHQTVLGVIKLLSSNGYTFYLEEKYAQCLGDNNFPSLAADSMGLTCDLIIVVGGDGSFLNASRAIVDSSIPILGINRGTLGFLADIKPDQVSDQLLNILAGEYQAESRSLLKVTVYQAGEQVACYKALNEVSLFHSDFARLLEFELYIGEQFVFFQRADGLIVSTPTGSTAYSLSAGGPIIYPSLDVFSVVLMFAHTLSARPIVVDNKSQLRIILGEQLKCCPKLSCDGQHHIELCAGGEIIIEKYPHQLKLLHPVGYNYFDMLRNKLGWNSSISSDR